MSRSRLVPVLLSAVLLVGAANLGAFAATGGPLLLGKGNAASKTTTLKTTGKGAALSLKAKNGRAPLKVSNSAKVTRLNADLVDGTDAAALRTKSYVYDLAAVAVPDQFVTFALAGLPPGRYVASFSVSADVTGAVDLFGCYLVAGNDESVVAVGLGAPNASGDWFASGSGYVDTTAATYRFTCQRNGGTATSIPAAPRFAPRLVLTRVDDVVRSAAIGAGSAVPRGVAP